MLLTAQLLFGVAFLKYAIKVEICPPLIVKYFLKKKNHAKCSAAVYLFIIPEDNLKSLFKEIHVLQYHYLNIFAKGIFLPSVSMK